MLAFCVRKLLTATLIVCGVATLVFVITRTFTDPARLIVPLDASDEQYRLVRAALHLDEPISLQYLRFLSTAVRGDLGDSYWQRAPVQLVLDRAPATLQLAAASMTITMLVALPFRIIAASKPDSWVDRTIVSASLLGVSVAEFWLGLMLIVFVAAGLGVLPMSGYGTWAHIILPAIATVCVLELARVILAESSSSFLGLGIRPPGISWGLMLADGRNYLLVAAWLVTFPGIAIAAPALSANLLASHARRLMDPYQRGRG